MLVAGAAGSSSGGFAAGPSSSSSSAAVSPGGSSSTASGGLTKEGFLARWRAFALEDPRLAFEQVGFRIWGGGTLVGEGQAPQSHKGCSHGPYPDLRMWLGQYRSRLA